jgi:hypothetical protein
VRLEDADKPPDPARMGDASVPSENASVRVRSTALTSESMIPVSEAGIQFFSVFVYDSVFRATARISFVS